MQIALDNIRDFKTTRNKTAKGRKEEISLRDRISYILSAAESN